MIEISKIHYEETIYPRKQHSEKTVEEYTESLLAGAKFPEIELQKVQYNGEVKDVLVDGWHRWQAHLNVCKQTDALIDTETFKSIACRYWQPDKILSSENTIDMLRLKLRAAEDNKGHGDRLTVNEKEAIAREIAEKCPKEEITQEEIKSGLGVSQATVSRWIADIRTKQTAGRDCLIHKLSLLGWTQEEIGEKVGLAQRTISDILSGFIQMNKTAKELHTFLSQGKTMDWIAEHYSIDMQLAWAIRLAGG